jgi:hypothetical protein
MPIETTTTAKLGALQRFAASLAVNSADLPQLEQSRLRFEDLLALLRVAVQNQAALVASKQESSRQLQNLLIECERLATVLRAAIKQHYGIRSEKLAEFNLQPFRGRKRKVKPQPEAPASSPIQPQPTPST